MYAYFGPEIKSSRSNTGILSCNSVNIFPGVGIVALAKAMDRQYADPGERPYHLEVRDSEARFRI